MDLFSDIPKENKEEHKEEKQKSTREGSIFSVSGYLDRVNANLKAQKAKIIGEVGSIQMYEGRSYLYFSIKDTQDQSTVKCFMWKNDYKISGVTLRDGMEVVVTAYPSVYKPNGGLSLQVELVELVGEGALQKAYEELKKKLMLEGLFDESSKRKIPEYPQKIGVITSKSGAVINDFLSNIGKYGFELFFVDSKVEGQDAIKDLLAAVRTLKDKNLDVLVMMRGGGSLESFLAFNNEELVRAICNFPVPVLTGIGHDKDAPLISLVSDCNVSTPTAVTHILNQSWDDADAKTRIAEEKIFLGFSSLLKDKHFAIENSQLQIERSFSKLFETFRRAEATLTTATARIERGISRTKESVENYVKNISTAMERMLVRMQETITRSEQTLAYSNPERQLKVGYSIVKIKGKVLRSTSEVSPGEQLDILVSDGTIQTIVQ